MRPGDNLYTCSVVALDADTGKLRWHFQFTPHDMHDWDANQIPVLADSPIDGRARKPLVTANRNGFYYVLDRATGEFLHGAPYAKQTWAKGLDAKGRPIVLPGTEPSPKGTLVWPSLQGATNWFSPSYSPQTGLFYVPVREMGSYYYKTDAEYEAGTAVHGRRRASARRRGVRRRPRARCQDRREGVGVPAAVAVWAGVMATAGGLVFGGTNEGNVYALDAETGEPLWDFQAGGMVRSNPTTFMVDGRQHVSVAAGHAVFVFALP